MINSIYLLFPNTWHNIFMQYALSKYLRNLHLSLNHVPVTTFSIY